MFFKASSPNNSELTDTEQQCLRQIKRLTQALILSGAVNILLLAFVGYGLFGNGILRFRDSLEPRLWRPADAMSHAGRTLGNALQSFQSLSCEQLIATLDDTSLVEDGYTERDIALAYLSWRHHFNLASALNGVLPSATRQLPLRCGNQITHLTLYPGLTQKQFDAITAYAKSERWPLTSEGLFLQMKRNQQTQTEQDSSLTEAFCLTHEFLALQKAFARADMIVAKEELLHLLLEGNWATFATASTKLSSAPELQTAALHEFLIDYLKRGSCSAARLIAKTQGGRKLDDATVLLVLRQLESETVESRAFASALLNSPRSDLVWKEAALRGGERYESPSAPPNAIATSSPRPGLQPKPMPNAAPLSNPTIASRPAKNEKVYIVQQGDSLWKIAKSHHIDVGRLKSYNQLHSDLLRPGRSLHIP